MKSSPVAVLLLLLLTIASAFTAELPLDLMPMPEQVTLTAGQYRVDSNFTAMVSGQAAQRLYSATTRMLRRLDGRCGLFFPQDYITINTRVPNPSLSISCQRPGQVRLGEDESYELAITPEKIELRCVTDIGGLRGLETLLQLLQADEKGFYFPAVTIKDKPRFPWRGLLIDVGRHWQPMDVIKRNLDAMAAVKMNVLHFHLTEDQGFRVESKLYPRLHQMGSDGLYFTQEEIKTIIAWADDRGIRVVPEFDMPGHTTSWFVGHPELASAPGPYSIERTWGVMDPAMNPVKESTYQLLDGFLGEMAALFPDPYLHIGGDESEGKHWKANAEIQAFMKANNIPDNHAMQAWFNKRLLQILSKHGKMMIGWDEILHPEMPKNIVIHSWRGPKFLVESARKGYQGILSNGYYIDLCQPADFHYLNDPVPPGSDLTPAEQARILGGEATMWSEVVSWETIDSRIWPRTAAIAERLWSPGSVRDVESMYRRMEILSPQLEELGLLHIKNYDMMLRRLANQQPIEPLKRLADVVEPVKIYERHNQGVTLLSFSPYTRLIDAARPESMTARNFGKLVDAWLANPGAPAAADAATGAIARMELWKSNHARLLETMKKAPAIREAEGLSRDLAALATAGLEAGAALQAGKKLGPEWAARHKPLLERAKKPSAHVLLMVAAPLEKLILAAQ